MERTHTHMRTSQLQTSENNIQRENNVSARWGNPGHQCLLGVVLILHAVPRCHAERRGLPSLAGREGRIPSLVMLHLHTTPPQKSAQVAPFKGRSFGP